MWRWLAMTSCVLLGACNVVLTKAPLFTQADAAGAPQLRSGVWLIFERPDCQVDTAKPFTDWPDCAGGGLVSNGEIAGHKSGTPRDALEHTPVVLAAGQPRIAQLRVDVDVSTQADASASGGGSASASASGGGESPPLRLCRCAADQDGRPRADRRLQLLADRLRSAAAEEQGRRGHRRRHPEAAARHGDEAGRPLLLDQL